MRNLEPYNEDSFEFYESVVASKRNSQQDPDYKERLQGYGAAISDQFEEYDQRFENDNLVGLANYGFAGNDKEDLLRLYSYKGALMQRLKINVTTTQHNRIMNTCQNCTISEVNSFDHFVNKDEFPEFSVHPKNLFPSCAICNSYKGEIWRENETIQYLNLYLDQLPEEQYLFVDITVNGGTVEADFSLDNRYGIDPIFFERVQNHYQRLHLCNRFRENSHSVIAPLENVIKSYVDVLSVEEVVDLVIESAERNMDYFGFNYWKSILEIELVSSDDFLNMAING